jgi:hypothetical protein
MRGTAWASGAAAAAVLLAGGCGTARYPQGASRAQGGTAAAAVAGRASTPAPASTPAVTRQQADRLARELLARAPLPAGAGRLAGPPVKVLRQPPGRQLGSPSVSLHALWTVAEPMTAAYSFARKNVPAGMAVTSTGQLGQAAGVPEQPKPHGTPPGGGIQPGNVGAVLEADVTYQLKPLPAGVSAATLSMSVAPAGKDMSEIRADVQVIWYPARSAAEHVPAGMHAVTITASYLNPKPGSSTRTFTSAAVVGRLAALLNGAPASTGGVASCPAIQVTYRLAFATSRQAAPYLTAADYGCLAVQVTAAGKTQPSLQLPAVLNPMLARLLHVPASSGTGVMTQTGSQPATAPAGSHPATTPARCSKPVRGVWSGSGMRTTRNSGTMPKSPCLAVGPAAP